MPLTTTHIEVPKLGTGSASIPHVSPANFVHHSSGHPELIDVLDRVLDKGIVIIYDIDVSLAGLRVVSFTGNVVIASIETYRRMTDDAVVQAQHSPALSHATDAFLRRVHTSTKSDGEWEH